MGTAESWTARPGDLPIGDLARLTRCNPSSDDPGEATGLTSGYCRRIRRGERVPHTLCTGRPYAVFFQLKHRKCPCHSIRPPDLVAYTVG